MKVAGVLKLVPKTLKDLKEKNPLQLAASTAFVSLFALPPILVVLTTILGIFIKPEFVSEELFQRISNILGTTGTEGIKNIFNNFQDLAESTWTSIAVFIFLIFIATNLFFLVQLNINLLWKVPPKSKHRFRHHLKGRLIALGLVLIGGVIVLIAILSDFLVAFIGNQIEQFIPNVESALIRVISIAFSLLTFTVWFTLLFKLLPSAKLPWKPAWVGGVIASVLFYLGQILIEMILVNSNIKGVFGASSSIVLVMLFIFYVSFIFYFVAMFIKNYADYIDQPIKVIQSNNKEKNLKDVS